MSSKRHPDARCPLRPDEPCTLCQLNTSGPHDCPLVYLVMTDDELRDDLHAFVLSHRATAPLRPAA